LSNKQYISPLFLVLIIASMAGLGGSASAGVKNGRQDTMALGRSALPPVAFLQFCRRQPADCGADPEAVLRQVDEAEAERASLLAMAAAHPRQILADAPAAMRVTVPAAGGQEPIVEPPPAARRETLSMGPMLWARLNRINDAVNRAIAPQDDMTTYGQADYWATPLEDGRKVGDCEDYVLEKQRALIGAGLPREALSIATVTTNWGEAHAVLLVTTQQGEFVLDNLSRQIVAWSDAPYRWNKRQSPGQPFHWVMVDIAPAS
jgi:predicted transglutaminase-like cysteine proteinase